MYNKILKNNQVYIGNAFEVRTAYMPAGRILQRTFEEQACAIEIDDPETLIEEAKEEAKYQVELIIKEAKLEAARIINEANEEAMKNATAVEEKARLDGYETGFNKGKSEYENLIKEAEEIKLKAEADYDEFSQKIEANAVKLIMDIAKKVIADEVNLNKENLLLVVRNAFSRCTNKEKAVITVSNEDYEYIVDNKDQIIELLGWTYDFEIRKDLTLENGSCLIETPFGTVDAGIDTKLRKIQEEFEKLMKLKH